MVNSRQRTQCLAIAWILSFGPCFPFVPVTNNNVLTDTLPKGGKPSFSSSSMDTIISSHRRTNNNWRKRRYTKTATERMAVKLDSPIVRNVTGQEMYFAQSLHADHTTDIPRIQAGNGVPLYGFEEGEGEGEGINGSKESVVIDEDEVDGVDAGDSTHHVTMDGGADVFTGSIEEMYEDKTRLDRMENSSRDLPVQPFDDNSQFPAEDESDSMPMRLLWRRRHARTMEEGIRRERATKLSSLLSRAQTEGTKAQDRRLIERTLMGLINAVAEEIEDLDVELTSNPNTPLWRKEVNELKITFSRLGFKPLRMGGSNMPDEQLTDGEESSNLSLVECADEAFNRIDKDDSGTLDEEEIAEALSVISADMGNSRSYAELASELVDLYDTNSDGVVDREEYQLMIEDMASLREKEAKKENPLNTVKRSVESVAKGISEKAAEVGSAAKRLASKDAAPVEPEENQLGSIVLSDLNLDLRRLMFGGVPVVKKVTPGGPLILEPFTATVTGSFSREDVMGSFLLDSALRLLVARVLRVRIRSYRDVVDGALFFGRRWKMASKSAPVVEVLGLSNVEFDERDKMVLTGRARIRAGPDAPVVTNTFKVRTKIGTGKRGQTIRLEEPELAFVFECPRAWENGLKIVCEKLGMPPPKRPEPFYSFFPIYSPLKVTDENAGFDMGDDNKLRQIFIKNGKLRFQMSAVLRPGRFLGSHYIAFTLPMRTFIITMDRVREGARTARKNKKIAAREKMLKLEAKLDSRFSVEQAAASVKKDGRLRQYIRRIRRKKRPQKPAKSFFSRFVEGYTLVEREGDAKSERLAKDISTWFGRQGSSNSTDAAAPTDA